MGLQTYALQLPAYLLLHYPVLNCKFQALKGALMHIFILKSSASFPLEIKCIAQRDTFSSSVKENWINDTQKESYVRLFLQKYHRATVKTST